jgi:glucosamine--fructose-6-phosphate aminotransferase (isomerizing)
MTFTESEIASQPDTWARALGLRDHATRALAAPGARMLVIGCGTSEFVADAVAELREAAGLGETHAAYASELPVGRSYDRVIAITRSGTTTEVLQALAHYRGRAHRVVVTGVAGSPAAADADEVLLLDFADERSVVQTRFPTTLLLLARAAFGADVATLPQRCVQVLEAALPIDVAQVEHFVYLGRGWTRGLAAEAALKIREAAQAWSESYPALDYRHGPVAVAGPRSMVWIFGPPPAGLVADVELTGAHVVHSDLDPLLQLVLAQRVAVALAGQRGLDPDRPRHLTRSVVLQQADALNGEG